MAVLATRVAATMVSKGSNWPPSWANLIVQMLLLKIEVRDKLE